MYLHALCFMLNGSVPDGVMVAKSIMLKDQFKNLSVR